MRPASGADRETGQAGFQRDHERLGGFDCVIILGSNTELHKVGAGGNHHLPRVTVDIIVAIHNRPSQRNRRSTVAGSINSQTYRVTLLDARRVVRGKRHHVGCGILNGQFKFRGGKAPAYRGIEALSLGESNYILVVVGIRVFGEIETHCRATRSRRYRVGSRSGAPVQRGGRGSNGDALRCANAYRQTSVGVNWPVQ